MRDTPNIFDLHLDLNERHSALELLTLSFLAEMTPNTDEGLAALAKVKRRADEYLSKLRQAQPTKATDAIGARFDRLYGKLEELATR